MTKPVIKILVGFICNVLLSGCNLVTYAHDCNAVAFDSYVGFDCSNRGLLAVPQDLDMPVEILLLQYNLLTSLDENSFVNYKGLIVLNLSSTSYKNQKNPIDYFTFRSLDMLEILMMENISTPFNFRFHWPPNLKMLAVGNNDFIESLDLSTLTQLTFLLAKDCEIHHFPKFNASAPVKYIDLRFNPLENMTVEDLAPLCLLRVFLVEWPLIDNPLSSPFRFCQCVRLEKWFHTFQIETGLLFTPFICIPHVQDQNCDVEFSNQLLEIRKACLQSHMTPLFSGWFLVIVGIIIIIPFIILGFWYFERQRKRQNREMNEHHNEDSDGNE